MNCRKAFLSLMVAIAVLLPLRSPAPLIYTPGEGWYYEMPGQVLNWQRSRARDQLEVAEQYFKEKDYSNALRAAYRVVTVWPLSDYAPDAEYLMARCPEAKGKDEAAFRASRA